MGKRLMIIGKVKFEATPEIVAGYSKEKYLYLYDIAGLQSYLEHDDWNKRHDFEYVPQFNIKLENGYVYIEFKATVDLIDKTSSRKALFIVEQHLNNVIRTTDASCEQDVGYIIAPPQRALTKIFTKGVLYKDYFDKLYKIFMDNQKD